MSDLKKVGVKIDESLWAEFRDDVERRKGKTRGVLGDELETAIRQYIYSGDQEDTPTMLRKMDERLQRLESQVGTTAVDGGPTPDSDEDTHTRREDKPAANAPRNHKVEYLISEFTADGGGGSFHTDALRNFIDTQYSFEGDTVDQYIELIVERLDAMEDPEVESMFHFGDAIGDRLAELEQDAEDEMETITDGGDDV